MTDTIYSKKIKEIKAKLQAKLDKKSTLESVFGLESNQIINLPSFQPHF